jgi:excisionase family DNA binding protein
MNQDAMNRDLELFTKKEVAALLKCSVSKIEKMMATGEISYIKIGKLVRFRESDIEKCVGTFVGTPHSPVSVNGRMTPHTPIENTSSYGMRRNGKGAMWEHAV